MASLIVKLVCKSKMLQKFYLVFISKGCFPPDFNSTIYLATITLNSPLKRLLEIFGQKRTKITFEILRILCFIFCDILNIHKDFFGETCPLLSSPPQTEPKATYLQLFINFMYL